MSLRPRYSLLTWLFILIAVGAGGAKLWYGPHRVTERTPAGDELEYSYTRDWQNNKTLHGPYVTRSNLKQKYPSIDVTYYRRGSYLNWNYSIFPTEGDAAQETVLLQTDSPLLPDEWVEFHRTIEFEKQRAYPPGIKLQIFEGSMQYFTF
jgi:hypothetical protein